MTLIVALILTIYMLLVDNKINIYYQSHSLLISKRKLNIDSIEEGYNLIFVSIFLYDDGDFPSFFFFFFYNDMDDFCESIAFKKNMSNI